MTLLADLVRAALEFNEDEHPRDERGRFGSKGDDPVQAVVDKAKEAEPAVSADLTGLAAEHGGEMYGYDFRIKSETSLERKVDDKVREGMTRDQAAASIKDALRYTVGFQPDEYAPGLNTVIGGLEKRGYTTVEAKNYWPKGDTYSGINCVMRSPDGQVFELQFHTPDSYAAKEYENHALYERYRAADTTVDERRELYAQMAAAWDDVDVPSGALDFGTLIHEEAP